MSANKYLIIGGGMTADAAIRGIRELDTEGAIGLISAEDEPPYDRPPLTKGLWKGVPEESIWRGTAAQGVSMYLGRRVRRLDLRQKTVEDDRGESHSFDKLLLATGGTPRRLPFGGADIIYYRTIDDYRRLRRAAQPGRRFAVIGGGFIGSEIAAALRLANCEVTMVFPGEWIGGNLFPAELGRFINTYYEGRGVRVLPRHRASGLEDAGDGKVLQIVDTEGRVKPLPVDGVVAGIGIEPNVDLAREAGIEVGDGIFVNAALRTSLEDVYAAGDVASFYSPLLDRRLRIEHEDNANTMGREVGRAMAGASLEYRHLSYFYSDLFDLGYEAVGDIDSRLETVADWEQPLEKGVIYYLREGRIRGVLLWNVWGQVEAARGLIAEPGTFSPSQVKGRLPKG